MEFKHAGDPERDPLHYKACGLDDVYLCSGYVIEETLYGEGVSVKNIDELHQAIGKHLIAVRKTLAGKEVRFLRHQMDLTQSELGRLLGCDSQQIARYEKAQSAMPGPSDRLLRLLYREHLNQKIDVRLLLTQFESLDDVQNTRMVFERGASGWKSAA